MRSATTLVMLCALAVSAHAADGEVTFGRAQKGEEHPDVRLPTIDREDWIALSDFRGTKVLLIEFASW